MSTLNKSTRITIAILTSLFFISQIILALTSLSVATTAIAMLITGKVEEATPGKGIMFLGIDTSNYKFSFLDVQQFNLMMVLLTLILCILIFFLFHYLRTLLQNLNDGEVFSSYNLKYIRRIMLSYLSIGILFFACKMLCEISNSRYIILGYNGMVTNLIQVLLLTAGIYTLYFVFRYGVKLKQDNEAIV